MYVNEDLVGVELCAAAKNVIALAAGACDGLAAGDKPRPALITRGLAEMARLGEAAGAAPETFYGLAGMGDSSSPAGTRAVATAEPASSSPAGTRPRKPRRRSARWSKG